MIRALIALVMGLTVMMPGIPMDAGQWLTQTADMGTIQQTEQSEQGKPSSRAVESEMNDGREQANVRPAVETTDTVSTAESVTEQQVTSQVKNVTDETQDEDITEENGWMINEATVTYRSGDTYAFPDGSHENKVKYRSAWKDNPETKYAHTDNVNDDGIQSGGYGNDKAYSRTVTIDGAQKLDVTLTYQTESTSYDWVCVYQGADGQQDCSASLTGKLGGTTKQVKTLTVDGDTVTFWFRSDGASENYYGYHAVVKEKPTVKNTVIDGEVMEPKIVPDATQRTVSFKGWNPDINATPMESDTIAEAVYKIDYKHTYKSGRGIFPDGSTSLEMIYSCSYDIDNNTISECEDYTVPEPILSDNPKEKFITWNTNIQNQRKDITVTALFGESADHIVSYSASNGVFSNGTNVNKVLYRSPRGGKEGSCAGYSYGAFNCSIRGLYAKIRSTSNVGILRSPDYKNLYYTSGIVINSGNYTAYTHYTGYGSVHYTYYDDWPDFDIVVDGVYEEPNYGVPADKWDTIKKFSMWTYTSSSSNTDRFDPTLPVFSNYTVYAQTTNSGWNTWGTLYWRVHDNELLVQPVSGSTGSSGSLVDSKSPWAGLDFERVDSKGIVSVNPNGLFEGCKNLKDASVVANWNFNGSRAATVSRIYAGCDSLVKMGLPTIHVDNYTRYSWMQAYKDFVEDMNAAFPGPIEEKTGVAYDDWSAAIASWKSDDSRFVGKVFISQFWSIEYDANGGVGDQKRTRTSTTLNTVDLPSSTTFLRFNYRFAGWTAQPDPISDMNPVLTTLTPATHNDGDRYTVYAQWEKLDDADEQPSTPSSGMLPGWIQVDAQNTSSIITPLQTGTTTFTNQYAPGSTSIVFKFTKLMDGNVPDQSYEFELLDQNGRVIQTVQNIGSTVAFQPINYTTEGEHVYLVREKNPNNDKLQYDDHLVQISVNVTGEGEQLKAEAVILGDTVFRNTSTPAVLSISKNVEHADQYTPDKDTRFTFDVELTDRDGKPVNGDYNMSIGDHTQSVTFKDGRLTITLKAGQTATIKDIPAHAKYKVSETNLPDGYTLKNNTLVNANGTLDANATVTVTAVNKYEPKNGAATVQAVKKLLYADTDTEYVLKADQFRFTLCEVRPTEADPDNCVGVADTTNLKDGTVTFPQLEYDQPGTHTYQMREVIGVDSGITYDKQIVTVTVNVTDNGSGRLQTTVNYRNGTEPTFVNRIWNAPLLPQTGNVTVWALCATILLGGVFLAVQRGKRG